MSDHCLVHSPVARMRSERVCRQQGERLGNLLSSSQQGTANFSCKDIRFGIVIHRPFAGFGPQFVPFLTGVVLSSCTCEQAHTGNANSVIHHLTYTASAPGVKLSPFDGGVLSVVNEPIKDFPVLDESSTVNEAQHQTGLCSWRMHFFPASWKRGNRRNQAHSKRDTPTSGGCKKNKPTRPSAKPSVGGAPA